MLQVYSGNLSSIIYFFPNFIAAFLFIISSAKSDTCMMSAGTTMDTVKSYLALGDSYTIGESVAPAERFPQQTVAVLRTHDVTINDPDIIAVTGWTTGNLLDALQSPVAKKIYSAVTLLIGVNNQYQGRTVAEYEIDFAQLLNMAICYAGNIRNHVFVLSIPDYSVTPFARYSDIAKIRSEIEAFNSANKSIARDAAVHYIDITTISRDAANDPGLTAPDGLHPSANQYKKWSELLAAAMLPEFQ